MFFIHFFPHRILEFFFIVVVVLTKYSKRSLNFIHINVLSDCAGNRWIVSIWSATPHKQPPLDFTELEANYQPVQYVHPYLEEYQEVHKRDDVPASYSQQPLTSSHEFLELHKRESDI